MSTKKKTAKNTPAPASAPDTVVATLAVIVAAGVDGIFAPDSVSIPLADAGLVEVNRAVINDLNEHPCRATAAGIAKVMGDGSVIAPVAASAPAFQIEKAVPIPAPVGRGRSGSKYPFESLQVGDSFFVADTEAHPDAAASLASTVSGATQRYAIYHPTETKLVKGVMVPKKVYERKFALRKVPGGARVWRIAVDGQAE
jgi:hypothetical protein